ncbi:acyltransferase [Paenibacillus mesotrionivorans]|uniref:Acyltransferase n=1 Tax=Paenibacillus mesotrionivorans TaxID=3160968 RepID=A0ACC7P1Q7_9BACL
MSPIDISLRNRLCYLGVNATISDDGYFNYPEEVWIGDHTSIGDGYWFNVATPGIGPVPKISIGEGTRCDRDVLMSAINRIEVGKNVTIGPYVYISDTDHQFREIGIPIGLQGTTTRDNQVIIGDNTTIGAHAVIVGNVNIGRDCIVAPNTVVTKDIPDGFRAMGVPSRASPICS